MTEKWTPGPWSTKWSKYLENTFIVQAGAPSNRVLASFDGDGDGPDAQSLADAHLIAAAPDLYDALKAYIAADDNTGNPATSIREYDKNMERARTVALAALSRARAAAAREGQP